MDHRRRALAPWVVGLALAMTLPVDSRSQQAISSAGQYGPPTIRQGRVAFADDQGTIYGWQADVLTLLATGGSSLSAPDVDSSGFYAYAAGGVIYRHDGTVATPLTVSGGYDLPDASAGQVAYVDSVGNVFLFDGVTSSQLNQGASQRANAIAMPNDPLAATRLRFSLRHSQGKVLWVHHSGSSQDPAATDTLYFFDGAALRTVATLPWQSATYIDLDGDQATFNRIDSEGREYIERYDGQTGQTTTVYQGVFDLAAGLFESLGAPAISGQNVSFGLVYTDVGIASGVPRTIYRVRGPAGVLRELEVPQFPDPSDCTTPVTTSYTTIRTADVVLSGTTTAWVEEEREHVCTSSGTTDEPTGSTTLTTSEGRSYQMSWIGLYPSLSEGALAFTAASGSTATPNQVFVAGATPPATLTLEGPGSPRPTTLLRAGGTQTLANNVVMDFDLVTGDEAVVVRDLTFWLNGDTRLGYGDAIVGVELFTPTGSVTTTVAPGSSSVTFSDIDESIGPNTRSSWRLELDLSPLVCAGAEFSATLDLGGVTATDDAQLPVVVQGAAALGRFFQIRSGTMTVTGGQGQQCSTVGQSLTTPFAVRVSDQSIDSRCGVRIDYSVVSPSGGGASLSPSFPAVDPTTALAESVLTLGSVTGRYWVAGELYNPLKPHLGGTTPSCAAVNGGGNHDVPVCIEAYAAGAQVVTTAQYDGLGGAGSPFGTFIAGIPATNDVTTTVSIESCPAAPALDFEVESVTMAVAGQVLTLPGQSGPTTSYTGSFAMENLPGGGETASIVVDYTNQTNDAEDYFFKALSFPGWISQAASLATSLTSQFDGSASRYHVGFRYPLDYAWSDTVETAILLFGGTSSSADLTVDVDGFFNLDESSLLQGTVSHPVTIFGFEAGATAQLQGSFDSEFEFSGGSFTLGLNRQFELGEKSVGSKTVLVYGVPVTAALDVGGRLGTSLVGTAFVDESFEFSEMVVSPGLEPEVEATGSLSALFGVARVALQAAPSILLTSSLCYSTAGGVAAVFGGDVQVALRLLGSLFWATGDALLGEAILGPYEFGDPAGSCAGSPGGPAGGALPRGAATRRTGGDTAVPTFLGDSDLSIASTGEKLVVFTKDSGGQPGLTSPEVSYQVFDGSSWSSPAQIAAEPGWFETGPRVVHRAGAGAMALWVANDGPSGLTDVNVILSRQDLRFATYDGTTWSSADALVDDDVADGALTAAFDPGVGGTGARTVALWVRDPNSDADVSTRSEWSIFGAVYDEATGSWSTPAAVSSAVGTANYDPHVAAAPGIAMALWVQDDDGRFLTVLDTVQAGGNVDYTNSDAAIYYALLESSWTTPGPIPGSQQGSISSPRVAWTVDGSAAIALWVTQLPGVEGGHQSRLDYAVFDGTTRTWGVPGAVTAGNHRIEDPTVVVASTGQATVTWRSTVDDPAGELYEATIDLAARSSRRGPTPARRLTFDRDIDWRLAAALGPDDQVSLLWRKDSTTSTADLASPNLTANLNLGEPHATRASIGAGGTVGAVDLDGDGLFDSLDLSIPVNVTVAGDFALRAEVLDGRGASIGVVHQIRAGLPLGPTTWTLSMAGGRIRSHGEAGPYQFVDVTLIDRRDSPVAIDRVAGPFSSPGYDPSSFAPGPVWFDKDLYGSTTAIALVTVDDPAANLRQDRIDTVSVHLVSDRDPGGFTVELSETGADSGRFSGAIGFTTGPSQPATSILQVRHHSMVIARYVDGEGGRTWRAAAAWQEGPLPVPVAGWDVLVILSMLMAVVMGGVGRTGVVRR